MTDKSKLYLKIMACALALAVLGAAYQYFSHRAALARYAAAPAPTPAQQEVLAPQDSAPQEEMANRMFAVPVPIEEALPAPVPPAAAQQPGAFEQKMLAYSASPTIQALNREIAAAIGTVSAEDFVTGDIYEKYFENPQIQKILLKYSKDPAFNALMERILADEEFLQQAARRVTPPGAPQNK